MRIDRVSHLNKLDGLRQQWNVLASPVPFRRFEWLVSWWQSFGAERGNELFVLAVYDNDRIVGLAPWYVHGSPSRGRVIHFLGSGVVCSDYLSVLVDPSRTADACAAISQWLSDPAQGKQQWDLLDLDGIDAADSTMAELAAQLDGQGNAVHPSPGPNCWRIELPGDWDDYVARLSKSHRKQVRRADRRFLESGLAQLHTVSTQRQMSNAFDILVDLHERRRHSLGEPGCFADPRFKKFLGAAAEGLLEANQTRLHWLEYRDRPVAAEIHLGHEGVTYAYQAGVDPEMLDEEPGRLITIATLKQAIAENQTAFDFLRGDEPYKAHFRAEKRPSIRLRAVPAKATARIRHNVGMAAGNVKSWLRNAGSRG